MSRRHEIPSTVTAGLILHIFPFIVISLCILSLLVEQFSFFYHVATSVLDLNLVLSSPLNLCIWPSPH